MGCFGIDAAGFRAGRSFVGTSQAIVAARPNFATRRTRRRELDKCNLCSHLCELQLQVGRRAHLEIGATPLSTETMIALAVALVLGATAAVAMINYDVNASLAASTPQNNPAAGATQNPEAGCDTNEAPIFRGQRPLHY
jgi:hypothetical protein